MKEIRHALIKCQNAITSYQIPGSKPDEKRRAKGEMEINVGLLIDHVRGIQQKDQGLHKEIHRLHNTYKQFVAKETDENLAALQNELDRIQQHVDNIEKGG